MFTIILFAAAVLAAFLVHEAGHFLIAFCFGFVLSFEFAWGALCKVRIPRMIWKMPVGLSDRQKGVVALAGFGAEFLAAPILYFVLPYYPLIAFLHLTIYPFYAGSASDFQWLEDGFLGISKRGWVWLDVLALCAVCWTLVYYAGRALLRCF